MKIIIVGPPRSGKSTYARKLRDSGIKTYCTDPKTLVKDVEEGVIYLPEGLKWSEASEYVSNLWFTMPGEWCVEGIATVRALRKYLRKNKYLPSDCSVIRFHDQYGELTPGQKSMAKAIDTIWNDLEMND